MAISLNGSSQSLEKTTAIVSGTPLTLACWVRPDNITAAGTCMSVCATSGINYFSLAIRGDKTGDPVEAIADGSTTAFAATSSGYSANAWQHVCGVYASTTSRAVYLNGGSKGTDTKSSTVSSLASTMIGGVWYTGTKFQNLAGKIAEAAAWNVALTDAEVASLAQGFSPSQVRPDALIGYWPLGGHHGRNALDRWKNKYDLSATGSPTYTDHPRVIYPEGPRFMPFSAPAPVATPWLYARGRSRVIGGGVS